MITPIQGRLLVKTKSAYEHLQATTDERFGTSKTRGEVVHIAKDIIPDCKEYAIKLGSIVYFNKFEDGAPYNIDGEDGYILIRLEEIGGVE